ncbi:DUF1292 domain-containing protein [Periweissella fabaria]|uniref:UPF0473 protein HF964_04835 n=3 Tax=Periweissella TaxID=2930384 RepID=A0A7X6N1R9_9LACO|nr:MULTISPECIES: DUF1292 domain-containing protein [Periweissella]MCM0597182.1 DUF1292 domain-containing protein [Periweissella fabaria]MCM0598585.1 DUF1292 domain-containing protein [Periweissella fabalis]MCM0600268.1 DUF1292 domain-containing protein [Periweissella ghanensis]NKZ24133.1 DUF1292 domain-containing protein [Periweissella fabalis]CAH0417033.1 hypothetical protein WFA24289_01350 [Periweissella fabaria]
MAEEPQEQQITLVDEDGTETLFNVLFTFTSDEYNKSYILLYPEGTEDDQEVDIQAFSFNPDEDGEATEGDLQAIEDDAEWDMVEEVLNTFLDDDGNFEA